MLTVRETELILKKVHTGDISAVQQFRAQHPDGHWSELRYKASGDSVLHVAARCGHAHIVRYLLENYIPSGIECRTLDNKTALHDSAQSGQLDTTRLLLSNGADVDALKKADWTPLMLACSKTSEHALSVAKELVQHGANLNYCNKDGWTVGHLTARIGDSVLFKYLLSHGLDTSIRARNRRTALHVAALHGHSEMIRTLLPHCDMESRDACGNTPFLEAVQGGHAPAVRELLGAGADGRAVNWAGCGSLHLAAACGHADVIRMLAAQSQFAPEDWCALTTDAAKATPLHLAARNYDKDVWDTLVALGAPEDTYDGFQRLPGFYLKTL